MARIIPVAPFDCVVFGATGDLTMRKLLPALYHRFRDRQIPDGSRIIAAARSQLGDDAYRARAEEALRQHVAAAELDGETARRFLGTVTYARVDGAGEAGWDGLAGMLKGRPEQVRPFYLATSPDLYGPICRNLAAHELVHPLSRVVLEKPIGHDLASARAINDAVGGVFAGSADLPDRPLPRQGDGAEPAGAALRQYHLRAPVERRRHRPRADHGGRDGGRGGAGRLLRQVGRGARHGAEPHAATPVPAGHGEPGVAQRGRGARREAEGAARAAADRAARGRPGSRCGGSMRRAR